MNYNLLDNQIELILKSLQNYTQIDKEKMNLIYATYESLNSQFVEYRIKKNVEISSKTERKENVI
jgi:hypothetical protein